MPWDALWTRLQLQYDDTKLERSFVASREADLVKWGALCSAVLLPFRAWTILENLVARYHDIVQHSHEILIAALSCSHIALGVLLALYLCLVWGKRLTSRVSAMHLERVLGLYFIMMIIVEPLYLQDPTDVNTWETVNRLTLLYLMICALLPLRSKAHAILFPAACAVAFAHVVQSENADIWHAMNFAIVAMLVLVGKCYKEMAERDAFFARNQILASATRAVDMETALQHMLDGLCESVVEVDASLRFVRDSERFSAFLLLEAERQLCGKKLTKFLWTKEDVEAVTEAIREDDTSVQSWDPPKVEVHLRDAIGHSVHVQMLHVPFTAADGARHHLIGFQQLKKKATQSTKDVESTVQSLGNMPPVRDRAYFATTSGRVGPRLAATDEEIARSFGSSVHDWTRLESGNSLASAVPLAHDRTGEERATMLLEVCKKGIKIVKMNGEFAKIFARGHAHGRELSLAFPDLQIDNWISECAAESTPEVLALRKVRFSSGDVSFKGVGTLRRDPRQHLAMASRRFRLELDKIAICQGTLSPGAPAQNKSGKYRGDDVRCPASSGASSDVVNI